MGGISITSEMEEVSVSVILGDDAVNHTRKGIKQNEPPREGHLDSYAENPRPRKHSEERKDYYPRKNG